jgi:hypothetical protein
MIERLARRRDAQGQFPFASEANIVIQPPAREAPVKEVRIGLQRIDLARVRCALRRRGANASEEYNGAHYCVLRFEGSGADLLGLPLELDELTSGRASHQIIVTGYRRGVGGE